MKRTFTQSFGPAADNLEKKRKNASKKPKAQTKDFSLAQEIIMNFESFEKHIQNKILQTIDN